MFRYERIISKTAKKNICASILQALPDWFGIEKAAKAYISACADLPLIACFDGKRAVGFVAVKIHGKFAAEIYVMGITMEYHRRGIGRNLMAQAEKYLAGKGIRFLQVKTLSPSRESVEYARTRQFYQSVGFVPLEEFSELWGKDNPCLLLIKTIA